MIQRIQSVYLLLAGVLSAIAFFMPLAYFTGTAGTWEMYTTAFTQATATTAAGDVPSLPWGILLLSLICVIIPVFCIFKYNNRKLQMTLCTISIVSYILYYAAYIAYGFTLSRGLTASFTPTLYIVLPSFALLSVILARKAIKSDEEKVRAADRIR